MSAVHLRVLGWFARRAARRKAIDRYRVPYAHELTRWERLGMDSLTRAGKMERDEGVGGPRHLHWHMAP